MFKLAVLLLLATSTLAEETPAVHEVSDAGVATKAKAGVDTKIEDLGLVEKALDAPIEEAKEVTFKEQVDEPLTPSQQKQLEHLMKQIDFDGIEGSVKDRLTKQILEKELRKEIEDHMNLQVKNIIQQYADIEKKWSEISIEEAASLDKLQTMSVKQMLKAIMTNLKSDSGIKELWKNSSAEDKDTLSSMNLDFDLKTGDVRIHSKALEEGGDEPVFDWNMNTQTGVIEEITRKDGRERIVEREINPDTLKVADDFFNIELPKDITPVPTPVATTQKAEAAVPAAASAAASTVETLTELGKEMPDLENMTEAEKKEWENMELQRDIAFKIMYFFIAFIIATFGLLYTYFKMSQQVEEDARREEMGVSKADYDKQVYQKETFFDFLNGNIDNETYVGNPYTREAMQRQRMESQQCQGPMPRNYNVNSHRGNEGFGANNLENLFDKNEEYNAPFAQYRQ